MKKALALVLAVILLLSTTGTSLALNQDNLIIVGGSSSAVWTIAAAQIGEMIKKIYPENQEELLRTTIA